MLNALDEAEQTGGSDALGGGSTSHPTQGRTLAAEPEPEPEPGVRKFGFLPSFPLKEVFFWSQLLT